MRAVVTGAAGGIGLATAWRLNADAQARSGQGARLLLCDVADHRLRPATERLRAAGATVCIETGSLSDPDTAGRIATRAASAFGGVDALVSNAGIIHRVSLVEMTVAQFDEAIAVNTRPTWLLGQALHPLLRASRGAIVATASIAAHDPAPGLGAYAASKAALLMLVRQLACEWGMDGIRVNSVSPGRTRTDMAANSGAPGPCGPPPLPNPLDMVGEAADQAAVIAFLLGPDARFVTGADVVADGGLGSQLLSVTRVAALPDRGD